MDVLTEIHVLKRNVEALHSALKLKIDEVNALRSSVDSLQNQVASLTSQVQSTTQIVTVLKATSFGRGPTS